MYYNGGGGGAFAECVWLDSSIAIVSRVVLVITPSRFLLNVVLSYTKYLFFSSWRGGC